MQKKTNDFCPEIQLDAPFFARSTHFWTLKFQRCQTVLWRLDRIQAHRCSFSDALPTILPDHEAALLRPVGATVQAPLQGRTRLVLHAAGGLQAEDVVRHQGAGAEVAKYVSKLTPQTTSSTTEHLLEMVFGSEMRPNTHRLQMAADATFVPLEVVNLQHVGTGTHIKLLSTVYYAYY